MPVPRNWWVVIVLLTLMIPADATAQGRGRGGEKQKHGGGPKFCRTGQGIRCSDGNGASSADRPARAIYYGERIRRRVDIPIPTETGSRTARRIVDMAMLPSTTDTRTVTRRDSTTGAIAANTIRSGTDGIARPIVDMTAATGRERSIRTFTVTGSGAATRRATEMATSQTEAAVFVCRGHSEY
jgi:hypothetical protein